MVNSPCRKPSSPCVRITCCSHILIPLQGILTVVHIASLPDRLFGVCILLGNSPRALAVHQRCLKARYVLLTPEPPKRMLQRLHKSIVPVLPSSDHPEPASMVCEQPLSTKCSNDMIQAFQESKPCPHTLDRTSLRLGTRPTSPFCIPCFTPTPAFLSTQFQPCTMKQSKTCTKPASLPRTTM